MPGELRLRVLGDATCESTGAHDIHRLCAQTKRFALLAYLAVAQPDGYHRRDSLLHLFWPSLDEPRGRDALSAALSFLRKTIAPDVVLSRGHNEVAINRQVVACDATLLRDRLRQGDVPAALVLYRGEFMRGFHVRGARELEEWISSERRGIRDAVARGARTFAEHLEADGDRLGAAAMAHQALSLSAHDEVAIRSLLTMLGRLGDVVGALEAYTAFAARLRADFDATPSLQTQAVYAALCRGDAPAP